MNKYFRNFFIVFTLLAISSAAFAQDGAIPILQNGLTEALDKIFVHLQSVAVKWLGFFILLQFVWTNWQLIIGDADLSKVFAKLMSGIFWFCICIYIFSNGSEFIENVGSYIMKQATGTTGVSFDPIMPIKYGIAVSETLLSKVNSTQSVLQSLNPFPSIMMGIVAFVILAVSALLAFKILMVFIETKMIIALSPLSFSLLGLNAFRDQGMAPLKYLVSMGIRIFLYGAILFAMKVFSAEILKIFEALPKSSDPDIWPPIWAAAMGYALLGAVALRSDSIAAILSSGSSQLSTGDAVAAGAAAGAAAGLAMSGASSIATAVASPQKLMSDVIKRMEESVAGAGISNASGGKGSGGSSGVDTGLQKPHAASQSMSSSPSAGTGQAAGPDFKTGSQGQPLRPEKNDGGKSGSGKSDSDSTQKNQNDQNGSNSKNNNSNNSGGSTGNSQNQNQGNNWNGGVNGSGAGIGALGGRQNDGSETPRREPRHDNENRPKRTAGDHLEKLNRNIVENAGPIQVQMNTKFDLD